MFKNSLLIHQVVQVCFFLVSNPTNEMSHFLMGVYDEFIKECRDALLNRWCMLNKLRKVCLRGRLGILRGQEPMMEVLLRVSFKSKTN